MEQAFITRRGKNYSKYSPLLYLKQVGDGNSANINDTNFLTIDLSKNYLVMCNCNGASQIMYGGYLNVWSVEKGIITPLCDNTGRGTLSISGTSLVGNYGYNIYTYYTVFEVS